MMSENNELLLQPGNKIYLNLCSAPTDKFYTTDISIPVNIIAVRDDLITIEPENSYALEYAIRNEEAYKTYAEIFSKYDMYAFDRSYFSTTPKYKLEKAHIILDDPGITYTAICCSKDVYKQIMKSPAVYAIGTDHIVFNTAHTSLNGPSGKNIVSLNPERWKVQMRCKRYSYDSYRISFDSRHAMLAIHALSNILGDTRLPFMIYASSKNYEQELVMYNCCTDSRQYVMTNGMFHLANDIIKSLKSGNTFDDIRIPCDHIDN